jgi:hypothetical protein
VAPHRSGGKPLTNHVFALLAPELNGLLIVLENGRLAGFGYGGADEASGRSAGFYLVGRESDLDESPNKIDRKEFAGCLPTVSKTWKSSMSLRG